MRIDYVSKEASQYVRCKETSCSRTFTRGTEPGTTVTYPIQPGCSSSLQQRISARCRSSADTHHQPVRRRSDGLYESTLQRKQDSLRRCACRSQRTGPG